MNEETCVSVPLLELIDAVPLDGRLSIDDADGKGTTYYPVGKMLHEAADKIRSFEALQSSKVEPAPSNMDMRADLCLLQEAYMFGQFSDDFEQPIVKPVRAAIRRLLDGLSHTSPALVATPEGWKPSEDEILKYAADEELFLFADEGDLLAIANGILELVQIKLNGHPPAPTQEQRVDAVAMIDALNKALAALRPFEFAFDSASEIKNRPQEFVIYSEFEKAAEAAKIIRALIDHPPQATKQITGKTLDDEQSEFLSQSHTKAELWDRFVSLQTGDMQKLLKFVENLPSPQPAITREQVALIILDAHKYMDDNDWPLTAADSLLSELQVSAGDKDGEIVPLKCPDCDDVGWYAVGNSATQEYEQCQCEFCYTTPNSIFSLRLAIDAAIHLSSMGNT
jgi:hypothetical protein